MYNNSVFIAKTTKLFNNIDEISEDFPLYCLSKVDEVFNKNVNHRINIIKDILYIGCNNTDRKWAEMTAELRTM
jgi:hypothetical protein